ncbi:tumor necrosis factor receptor superfamily member 16 [Exaiptasia diaphana]|uniref:Uncharacterized protein n=1 Tax=Exaiptasia diaphana TaxID=2652724 RepID=A0A913XHP8_EXADI|nr:tumor necrosis factor receptor superfamily member 16 [Exaiptasia diaphana]
MFKKVFITVFISFFTVWYKFAEGRCFDPNHIEVCNDVGTKCSCRPCLSCPPGFGQNYECGGRSIKTSQKLKCVHCVVGTTYSDTNSSAMCRPCPQCHGHVMLRPCTSVTPTKCSPDICDEGFVWNDVVEICEPGQAPITTPTPATTTTTATPVSTPSTHSPTSQAVTQRANPSRKTSPQKTASTNQPNDESVLSSNSKSSTEHKEKIDMIWIVVLVIGIVLVLAAISTGVYCSWKKSKKCKRCMNFCKSVEEGEKEEKIALNNMRDSPPVQRNDANAQPVPVLEETWPSGYLLKAVPYNLQEQIIIAISNVNPPLQVGWKEIGQELGLDRQALDGIESFASHLRGSQLLEVLGTRKPTLTLTDFVKAVIKVKRNDLVESIKQFFLQNNAIGND